MARGIHGGAVDGSRRGVREAAANLLQEGNAWARRVTLAERAHRRAAERDERDEAEVARLAEERDAARADTGPLRAAADELERRLDACPEPDAPWARRARVELERTRAGLEGHPDPHPDAAGLRAGWIGIPPMIRLAIAAWVLVAIGLAVAIIVNNA